MITFVLYLIWALVLLLALIGWGEFIRYLLFPDKQVDPGQKACWGMSFLVLIGGILNLFCLIYKPLLAGLVGIGFLFSAITLFKSRKDLHHYVNTLTALFKKNQIFLLTGIFIVLLFLIKYTYPIYNCTYLNNHDDYQGYLVHPLKMIQMHTLGEDPFNTRQMVTSLGAGSFLQTFVIGFFPLEYISALDQSVGLVIIVLLLVFYREKEFFLPGRLFLTGFFLISPLYLFIANVTCIFLPIAFFISIFRLLEGSLLRFNYPFRNSFLIAMMISTLCALKSTNISVAILLFLTIYFIRFIKSNNRKIVIMELCLAVMLIFFMLLPWMITMYRSFGTAFYPLLGTGYHAESYSDFSFYNQSWDIISVLKFILYRLSWIYFSGLLILSILFAKRVWKNFSDHLPLIFFILIAFLGLLANSWATHGYGIDRYSFTFIYSALIMLIAEMIRFIPKYVRPLNTELACLLIVSGMVAGEGLKDSALLIFNTYNRASQAFHGTEITSPQEQSQYMHMQNMVPESAVVLARVQKPFLLNFKRNTVYVADLPGETSPPPGLPYQKGPEAISAYLLSHSIQYVLYSYHAESGFSKTQFGNRLGPDANIWVRFQAERVFDFQDNLLELKKTKKVMYDDGECCVICLSGHSSL